MPPPPGRLICPPPLATSRTSPWAANAIVAKWRHSVQDMGATSDQCPPAARKRVAIVGAGAAGMAAAWSLSRHPDEFDVTVIEAGSVPGGVACTFTLPDGTPVNYGVQGGSPPAHQNTIELMRQFGVKVGDCRLDVSFGQGENNWKNYEARPRRGRGRGSGEVKPHIIL